MNEAEMLVVRRAYAKQIMFASGLEDPRLEAALAKLPREAFLGPGPWPIMRQPSGYQMTPDNDPVYLYQDVLVGMLSKKGLNNGQPSFLMFLISLGRPREGENAVHIGAGQGYYTAVIAQLVGDAGKVTAIEYEQDLAIRAAANLSAFSHVRVVQGDGTKMPLEPSDVIYVNAGAVHPANTWLDAMKDGGRLILPLTVGYTTSDGHAMTRGAIFLIERKGDDYLAQWKSESAIYPCLGARDAVSEAALAKAFEKGGWEKVTRLYRTEEIEEERCWVRGPDWSLAYS
ncbi:MAG: methyltransferase domain-containing protein [Acidobacteria bacterium]|nr:methyltransferase domain-containing protein [Acidobacteriota bacterium]